VGAFSLYYMIINKSTMLKMVGNNEAQKYFYEHLKCRFNEASMLKMDGDHESHKYYRKHLGHIPL